MPFIKSSAFVAVFTFASKVATHGYVQGIVADGVYYQGYNPSFQFLQPPPALPGWSDPKDLSNGYVNDYASPDIICHLDATPGQAYATVAAGGKVELQWTDWPPNSHHGPMISYLANCNGECTDVDKMTLLWNKIDEAGLISDEPIPGIWGSDEMIANNNSWTVTIPSTIAVGNYVLRHETIALHAAGTAGGAQNYPQCINLKVTGGGSNSLSSGTLGTALYTTQDPGILINIYQSLSGYTIPGPALIAEAVSYEGSTGNSTVSATSAKPTTLQTVTRSASASASAKTFISASVTDSVKLSSSVVITSTLSETNAAAVSSTTGATVITTGGEILPTAIETSKAKKFVCYEVSD